MENKDSIQEKQPKIGIVLSSGGLKPWSAMGLFEFLDEEQIDVDLYVGSSGGAVMAGCRGVGMDNQQIAEATTEFLSQKAFGKVDYQTLLSIGKIPFGKFNIEKGLLRKNPILNGYHKVFGSYYFESLVKPTLLQTTDIQTGKGVVVSKGSLADAMYASAAIYPMIPPLLIDGKWLVDGGYTSPLPVLEAVKRHMDLIIVMIFQEDLKQQPNKFQQGFSNVISAFSRSLLKAQLSLAIDLHHYEIIAIHVPFSKTVSLSDASQIPFLLEMGQRAVEPHKEEILAAIKRFRSVKD